MFTAEVKFYDPDEEREFQCETWDEAVAWLHANCRQGFAAMWIDNVRMNLVNGEIVESRSIGDMLHAALTPPTVEEMNKIFRPQPTRGSAPTNPSTLLTKGEAL